jgi:hypothetical protein
VQQPRTSSSLSFLGLSFGKKTVNRGSFHGEQSSGLLDLVIVREETHLRGTGVHTPGRSTDGVRALAVSLRFNEPASCTFRKVLDVCGSSFYSVMQFQVQGTHFDQVFSSLPMPMEPWRSSSVPAVYETARRMTDWNAWSRCMAFTTES